MKRKILFVLFLIPATNYLYAEEGLATAKGVISTQIEFLKSGDLENFKSCFTERQKIKITKESMLKGQKEISNYTIDDLVSYVIEGEYNGEKTIKIKMADGRTLTTLIFQDGKWLADTIWYK